MEVFDIIEPDESHFETSMHVWQDWLLAKPFFRDSQGVLIELLLLLMMRLLQQLTLMSVLSEQVRQ